MEELRPCPFCGGEAEIKRIDYGYNGRGNFIETYRVGCRKCGIKLRKESEYETKEGQILICKNGYEDCVKEWNTRSYDKYDFSIDKYGITFKNEIVKEGTEEHEEP